MMKELQRLEKRKIEILTNSRGRNHQTIADEGKNYKTVLQTNERKPFESKVFSRNLIKEINTWIIK